MKMSYKSNCCPNCGASHNPLNTKCTCCGSIVITPKGNQYNIPEHIVKSIESDAGNFPGVYVFGTLLGKGETPLRFGTASYFVSTFWNVGGKVLLTKKSLQFSTHNFLQSKDTVVIPLKSIIRAEYDKSKLGISDTISVYTEEKHHKFLVYGGKEWVAFIEKARIAASKPKSADSYAAAPSAETAPTPTAKPIIENVQPAWPKPSTEAAPAPSAKPIIESAQHAWPKPSVEATPAPAAKPAVENTPAPTAKAKVTVVKPKKLTAECAEELLMLKQLYDAGVITEEEFALKKKQLLNL